MVSSGGTYNFQFSVQLYNTGGGGTGETVNIWLRKNNVDIADTDTKVVVPTNAPYVVAAWNFVIELNAGDYLELVMWAQGADVKALTEAAFA